MLDITRIQNLLQHRYPFLLIDRVLEFEEGKRVKAIKHVSFNENFFQGHFPSEPIMPGVLIIEAMAQASAIIIGKEEGYTGLLTGIYKAEFKVPVRPGDTITLESEIVQRVKNLIRVKATATVNEKLVTKAELGFVVVEKPSK
ncbi:3-hydroxyacyl-ACP dehydratase FabZ [Candidatus Omnitrophota bacterium]